MKFSLLVPTRERLVELCRLLQSIVETIENPSNLEVLIAVDEDDSASLERLPHIIQAYPTLTIKYFPRIRSEFINRDYYNWLATFATGDYLFVSADDLIYLVPNWDTRIERYIESYLVNKPDRIMCAGIKDNTPKPSHHLPPFPCFPLITKEAFKYLSFVLHPFIPTWGADYLVYLLYTGIDRYLVIEDIVYINHVSYHTRQCEPDAVNINVGNIFNRLKMRVEYNVDGHAANTLPGQIEDLRKYIYTYEDKNERMERPIQ